MPGRNPYVQFYDFVVDHTAELQSLLQLARLATPAGSDGGARILECGAGTGRLSIPLAADGHRVTALEHSEAMRDALDKKLATRPGDVRERVTVLPGDFTRLPGLVPADAFDLVVFSSNTLCLAADADLQLRALRGAAVALRPGGHIFVEQLNPTAFVAEAFRQREVYLIHTKLNDDTGLRTARFMSFLHDAVNQHLWATTIIEEFGEAGSQRHSWVEHLRYSTVPEMRLRLQVAGFGAIRMHGGHDGEPIDHRTLKLVVTAQRTAGQHDEVSSAADATANDDEAAP
ncbi:MAG: class I SAM-dependent methyltransferase [Planctomycetota bacterium]